MNNIILKDNTLFHNVTETAKEIWNTGIFELYEVNEVEQTERLIDNSDDLNKAIENGSVFIECGKIEIK